MKNQNCLDECFFSEAEICQLADIQDSIQRMREGDLCSLATDKQTVEARLSSSCPSLVVDSGDEVDLASSIADSGQTDSSRRGQHRGHTTAKRGDTTHTWTLVTTSRGTLHVPFTERVSNCWGGIRGVYLGHLMWLPLGCNRGAGVLSGQKRGL